MPFRLKARAQLPRESRAAEQEKGSSPWDAARGLWQVLGSVLPHRGPSRDRGVPAVVLGRGQAPPASPAASAVPRGHHRAGEEASGETRVTNVQASEAEIYIPWILIASKMLSFFR